MRSALLDLELVRAGVEGLDEWRHLDAHPSVSAPVHHRLRPLERLVHVLLDVAEEELGGVWSIWVQVVGA